mmetsp:Transcript_4871/g.6038  ORF Transcript_4871/g.6038 Transcript_4871/m.6038 type:complete len:403 (-) Transcript_4871:385-1593(-)
MNERRSLKALRVMMMVIMMMMMMKVKKKKKKPTDSQAFDPEKNTDDTDQGVKSDTESLEEKTKLKELAQDNEEMSGFYEKIRNKLYKSVGERNAQVSRFTKIPRANRVGSPVPWLFSRALTNTWRGVGTLQIRASAATAFFISILFWRGQDTQRRGQLLLGAWFLSTIFQGIFTINSTITLVPSEVPTLRREYYNGLYTVTEYLCARLSVAALIQTAAVFAYTLVFFPLIHRGGYGGNAQGEFLTAYLALLFLGLTANLLGVIIGSIAPNQTVATIAVSPVAVPPLMCAGYFFHKNDLTKNIQHVIYPFWYLSYIRYCFYIVVTAEFRHGTFAVCQTDEYCPFNSYVVDPTQPVKHDVVIREYLDIPEGTIIPYFYLVQLGFLVGCFLILIVSIKRITLRSD